MLSSLLTRIAILMMRKRGIANLLLQFGAWKIVVDDDALLQTSSNGHPVPLPRKIPSLGLLSSMETVSKLKWSKNGYRKLKNADHHLEAGTPLPQSQQLTRVST